MRTVSGIFSKLQYTINENCIWYIRPPAGYAIISIYFSSFDTEQGYDFVRVYDGTSTASPLIGSYSGNLIPFSVNSTQGTAITVTFISDDTVVANGFSATYTATSSVTSGIDLTTGKGTTTENSAVTTGTVIDTAVTTGSVVNTGTTTGNMVSCQAETLNFESGSFSKIPYYNNENCIWDISPPVGFSYISITFSFFSTEAIHDYLAIYDGPSALRPLIGNFSGSLSPFTVRSSQGVAVHLEFHSDDSIVQQGFSANYVSIQDNNPASIAPFLMYSLPLCFGLAVLVM